MGTGLGVSLFVVGLAVGTEEGCGVDSVPGTADGIAVGAAEMAVGFGDGAEEHTAVRVASFCRLV